MSDEQEVEQPEPAPKADKPKKEKKPGKPKKDKKADKPEKGAAGSEGMVTLNRHPRAAASVARLRSRFGLGSAVFVAFLTHSAGAPLDDCILRGLTAGMVGYFVGWYVGVTVWRQLIRAELRVAYDRRAAAKAEAEA